MVREGKIRDRGLFGRIQDTGAGQNWKEGAEPSWLLEMEAGPPTERECMHAEYGELEDNKIIKYCQLYNWL